MRSTFASLLKRARTRAGLTQREVADVAKVATNTVARWERGEMAPGFLVQRFLLEILEKPQ